MDVSPTTVFAHSPQKEALLFHEDALAAAITEELGLPEPSDEVRIYARFALQIQLLVTSDTDPMLDAGFRILDQGWSRYHPAPDKSVSPS